MGRYETRREHDARLLGDTCRRKDLWMIKTIYLVKLLKLHGVEVEWILQFQDKQELYEKLEAICKELEIETQT